jgi:hypothetical protein
VWRPFERGEMSGSDWSDLRDALDRLRPLAAQSLLAVFQVVMTDVVEETLDSELGRIAKRRKR